MKIAFVSSEVAPFSKTGGLADVSGSLPTALAHLGCEVHVFTPLYTQAIAHCNDHRLLLQVTNELELRIADQAWRIEVHSLPPSQGLHVHFIAQPMLFARDGLYNEGGLDYPDNALRFAVFCHAVAQLAQQASFDLVHANDWQTALLCALLRESPIATLFSIHNLAYQGRFARAEWPHLGCDSALFHSDALEYYGDILLMKAGIVFADGITTVSRTYAREICTPLGGAGLDGLLRQHQTRLRGIENGIDITVWNPACDPVLPAPYDPTTVAAGKARTKHELQASLGLAQAPTATLFGVVSRLAEQKGIHLICEVASSFAEMGAQFAILGSGDRALEDRLSKLQLAHPSAIAVRLGFDENLAHRITGAADVFLMPSRYEPCGLNQLYAMRYGTLPLVRNVGGLADTVIDAQSATGTGFVFHDVSAQALAAAMQRAITLHADGTRWSQLVHNAMQRDSSWTRAAQEYVEAYAAARRRREEQRNTHIA